MEVSVVAVALNSFAVALASWIPKFLWSFEVVAFVAVVVVFAVLQVVAIAIAFVAITFIASLHFTIAYFAFSLD